MTARFALALAGALFAPALLPTTVVAQEETSPVVLGAYYRCDQSQEDVADDLVQTSLGMIFDRHVKAGHLTAWGWLSHNAGGEIRRVAYWVAPDRTTLIHTRDAFIAEIRREQEDAIDHFNAICPSHDDYIWNVVASSDPGEQVGAGRPAAGLSTYYVCDFVREERADTLVMEAFAPIFDAHVEAGQLASWSWLAHDVGGKWRRLAVFNGEDHASLLEARDRVIEDMLAQQAAATREFGEICGSHEDYLWDVTLVRP